MSDDGLLTRIVEGQEAAAARIEKLEELVRDAAAGAEPVMPAAWLVARGEDEDPAEYRENALAAWHQFVEWVVAVQGRYNLSNMWLPVCWAQHGAVVEELTALWIAHVDAYAAGGKSPAGWHDGFFGALGRIRTEWAVDCRAGTHRSGSNEAWSLNDFDDVAGAGPPAQHPNLRGSLRS